MGRRHLRLLSFLTACLACWPLNAEIQSLRIESRLDPNAITISNVDIVFAYDQETAARIPGTKSAWYGNRRNFTRNDSNDIDHISVFIPQGFDSASPLVPARAAEAVRVVVFAEHDSADASPIELTNLHHVLVEIITYGIAARENDI